MNTSTQLLFSFTKISKNSKNPDGKTEPETSPSLQNEILTAVERRKGRVKKQEKEGGEREGC